jgi:integrase
MEKRELQNLRLESRYKRIKELSGKEFPLIQKFIDVAKNGENNKGIDIKSSTERKYIDGLSMAYNCWKKPLLTLTKESLTELKQDLKSGKLKSRFKKPFSLSSQREMELLLIRFLEFANPQKYSGLRKWFIVKVPRKDVDFLKEKEIMTLYNSCKSNEEKFLIAVLFDSGARASEFLNIRFEDITEPTQNFPYYKINFKEEYSKTKGRNVGLYWGHSTEAIKSYLEGMEGTPKDIVYPKSYDAIRIFLSRLGKRVLNKRIHFHIFRKSSATHYAQKLTSRQQLCYRYGWNFSSAVPDVYISREQGEEEVKDNLLNTDLQKVEKQNQELKTKMMLDKEEFEKEIEELKAERKINAEGICSLGNKVLEIERKQAELKKENKEDVQLKKLLKLFMDVNSGKITKEEAVIQLKNKLSPR